MQPDDRTLTRVARMAWLVGAAATLAALVFASRWFALSLGAGAAFASLNFEALRRLGRRLVVPGRGKPAVALVLGVKVVALFALLYVLVVKVGLDGIALGAGASVLVLSIVLEGLRASLTPPETEEA